MRILLTGGGTAGSVTPLLALAEELKSEELLFVGTKTGPEKELVEAQGIKLRSIYSGKFRRYFSWKNFTDIILIKLAFFQSLGIILKFKPEVIVTAGSFVSVPLVWAGWFCRKKILVHQQDVEVGLANKLMRPFAHKVTKAFKDSKIKAEWLGNPMRDLTVTTNNLKLNQEKPVLLFIGGGTGSIALNKLVSLALLDHWQVIHLTGKGKKINSNLHPDYQAHEFLTEELKEALQKADLVVSRAGLGVLTELAILGKPSILIPMPDSHQEINANYFSQHQAAIVLKEKELDPKKLAEVINDLFSQPEKMKQLSEAMQKIFQPKAKEKMVAEIKKLCAKN